MRLSPTGIATVAVSSLSLITLGPTAPAAVEALTGPDFNGSLAALAALVLVILSAWILVCVTLSMLSTRALVLARLSQTITPSFVRRAMFLGAAGALVVGPVCAVGNTGESSDTHRPSAVSKALDGLRLPDRPLGASPLAKVVTDPVVMVRPGDSLWSIAARHLNPGASNSEISAAAHAWYSANRTRIGSDPNLILPHQQLTPPAKEAR